MGACGIIVVYETVLTSG